MKRMLSMLVGLFAHNWGLKILALVLSLVIYYSLKPSGSGKERTSETSNDRTFFQSR